MIKNIYKKKLISFLLLILFAFYTQAQDILSSKKIIINSNLELVRLNDNVWIHISYINLPGFGKTPANGLVVIDSNEAVLIDTPWNNELTDKLIEWVKNNLKIEIKYLIVTHFHDDCMGGIKVAHRQNIESYSLYLTSEIAKQKGLILPQKTFKNSLKLKINSTELIINYPGAGHTVDNIVVWMPKYKILFGGCLVKSLKSKNLGNLEDADIKEWPRTLQRLLKIYENAAIVVPGHGQYGGTDLIVHTIKLCKQNK